MGPFHIKSQIKMLEMSVVPSLGVYLYKPCTVWVLIHTCFRCSSKCKLLKRRILFAPSLLTSPGGLFLSSEVHHNGKIFIDFIGSRNRKVLPSCMYFFSLRFRSLCMCLWSTMGLTMVTGQQPTQHDLTAHLTLSSARKQQSLLFSGLSKSMQFSLFQTLNPTNSSLSLYYDACKVHL